MQYALIREGLILEKIHKILRRGKMSGYKTDRGVFEKSAKELERFKIIDKMGIERGKPVSFGGMEIAVASLELDGRLKLKGEEEEVLIDPLDFVIRISREGYVVFSR